MNPDFTLIWPLSCLKDGDHLWPVAPGPQVRRSIGRASPVGHPVAEGERRRGNGKRSPQYVSPSELPGAIHDFALLYLGVHLFDNCDLEALSEAAAERNRWEFLLMAAPLPIRGGTGSPLNPIAVF